MQFQPIHKAFSRVSPCGKSLHSFVRFRILVETHGYVSGIGMFDDMSVESVCPEYLHEHEQGKERAPIHVDYQCLV